MPVNLQHNIVFVHIPKTAGSSVECVLGIGKDHAQFTGWDKTMRFQVHMQHLYLSELEQELDLTAFKIFTVVRNPYDRLVSAYQHQKTEKAYPSENFEYFVKQSITKENRRAFFDGHLETQVNYIESLKGNCCKIFRFEELNKCSAWLASQLGHPIEFPHLRKSDRLADYREYYKSEDLLKTVTAFYRQDLAAFDYTF